MQQVCHFQIRRSLLASIVLSGAFGCPATDAAAAIRPNFVFILVDDLGRADLSCEGSTFYETPNIDQLAARSMRFENGYAACQVCSPSRAAIQTGRHPARVSITDYISPAGNNQPEQWGRNTALLPAAFELQLALEETTIAESLRDNGYQTFFAGKWHLGGKGFLPTDQGYEINRGGHEAGTPPGGFFAPYRNPVLDDGPPGESLPLRLGRETAEFVEHHTDQPFFAMLAFYSVHAPIQSTPELWAKYRAKAEAAGLTGKRSRFAFDRTMEVRQVQDHPVYAGMMEAMDTAVGSVLDAIDRAGIADHTVVVFTADNGGVSSGDGFATSSLPLRGGKGRQWEGGIREPYYICWPGVTTGTTTDVPATGMDFFPTFLEIAGLQPLADRHVDGVSLVPALKGQAMPERSLFWHYPHYGNQGGEPSAILRRGAWKLIHYFEVDRNELYDLAEDIGEQHDLAANHPDRVTDMWDELRNRLKDVNARFPTRNPRYNADRHAMDLERRKSTGMANREREHARVLESDFVPNGGWWNQRGADGGRKKKR